MIKTKPKNSALNKNKIPDALQKAKIRKRTEWTGFCESSTKRLLKIKTVIKK